MLCIAIFFIQTRYRVTLNKQINKMRYWEILLDQQKKRGRAGLTLPFIIGSQYYIKQENLEYSIESLLIDIIENSSSEICIRHCIATQALIFEIRHTRNAVYFPLYADKEQNNLSVSVSSKIDLGENVEMITDKLKDRYQDIINEKMYSAEPNVNERYANWREFSIEDKIFINECFNTK